VASVTGAAGGTSSNLLLLRTIDGRHLPYRWGNNGGRDWRGNREPRHSINFITAHDGFPLADLVSYNEKHNEANGEDNRRVTFIFCPVHQSKPAKRTTLWRTWSPTTRSTRPMARATGEKSTRSLSAGFYLLRTFDVLFQHHSRKLSCSEEPLTRRLCHNAHCFYASAQGRRAAQPHMELRGGGSHHIARCCITARAPGAGHLCPASIIQSVLYQIQSLLSSPSFTAHTPGAGLQAPSPAERFCSRSLQWDWAPMVIGTCGSVRTPCGTCAFWRRCCCSQ